MPNNLFYTYYDALFQHKDYSAETDLVFKLSEDFGIKNPKKILEIGCGTGNHTLILSEKNAQVVAIDTDANMVGIAKDKVKRPNVSIIHSSIEDLKESGFDLSLAMFNVVTYIPTFPELLEFMKAISDRLKPGGILVFDCWNGIAAIKDPPQPKTTNIQFKGDNIECILTPVTDFFNQKTTLNYDIKVSGKGEDSFSFDQTLWTPMQIQFAIEQAGLETLLCSPVMNIDQKATDKDWKIMFCSKKSTS